ncbi:hypothetical protein PspLS_11899 [Pyricularia sp. CBS 133598]|nr:hypothetical protein PspLS_11899 [Pyricularia sp. CBS 133598]
MCTYQYMDYSCGHRRTIAAEWCDRYRNKLQSHIRCRPEIPYYTKNDQICSHEPAVSFTVEFVFIELKSMLRYMPHNVQIRRGPLYSLRAGGGFVSVFRETT